MSDKLKMTVTMEVTEPQALALQAMFEYMNQLGGLGASRYVAFFADGDGDFKPQAAITYNGPVRPLTKEMAQAAIIDDEHGHRKYDYDPIGWMLHED